MARPLLLLAAALGAACDPQVDRYYPGEPLLTLRGQITGTAPLPPLEAAILWQRGPPPSTNDQELATRAPVEAGFPATFTLRLYQPPPPGAVRRLREGEVAWARGNAGAVPYGIAVGDASQLPTSGSSAYGVDVHHWILHLEGDVPQGSLTAWWLGAALPAGYHLVKVEARNPACVAPADLEACAAALVALGVPDDGTTGEGTARGFCLAPYRLSPAPPGETLVLELRVYGPDGPGGPCP